MRLNNETTEFTNVNRQLEIDNFETEVLNIDCTNNETIEFNWDKSTTYQIQCRFLKIIENSYVKATRPEKPMIRAEMKLCLDNAKPFSCSPRRLSHTEKDKLKKLLDEYLQSDIIRPSESEFASPTVLVKKKTG